MMVVKISFHVVACKLKKMMGEAHPTILIIPSHHDSLQLPYLEKYGGFLQYAYKLKIRV